MLMNLYCKNKTKRNVILEKQKLKLTNKIFFKGCRNAECTSLRFKNNLESKI